MTDGPNYRISRNLLNRKDGNIIYFNVLPSKYWFLKFNDHAHFYIAL